MTIANFNSPKAQGKDFRILVKHRMLEIDLTVTQLAKDMELARNTVSMAINDPKRLPSVKKRIRKHLRLK